MSTCEHRTVRWCVGTQSWECHNPSCRQQFYMKGKEVNRFYIDLEVTSNGELSDVVTDLTAAIANNVSHVKLVRLSANEIEDETQTS